MVEVNLNLLPIENNTEHVSDIICQVAEGGEFFHWSNEKLAVLVREWVVECMKLMKDRPRTTPKKLL